MLIDPQFSDFRFKNCFFTKRVAKDQAEAALLRLLKAEIDADPTSQQNSGEEQDIVPEPAQGLAGVFQQLRQRGGQGQGEATNTETEEDCLKKYLDAELETVACLKYWEKQEREDINKIKSALCRLARFVLYTKISFF